MYQDMVLKQPPKSLYVAPKQADTVRLDYFQKPVLGPLGDNDSMAVYKAQTIAHLSRGEVIKARECLSAALAYSNKHKIPISAGLYVAERYVANAEKQIKQVGRDIADAIHTYELQPRN